MHKERYVAERVSFPEARKPSTSLNERQLDWPERVGEANDMVSRLFVATIHERSKKNNIEVGDQERRKSGRAGHGGYLERGRVSS
jgi:hypothetical protein